MRRWFRCRIAAHVGRLDEPAWDLTDAEQYDYRPRLERQVQLQTLERRSEVGTNLLDIDRWTQRMKEVLPTQAFMNRYYPSWTKNGTLIISYVCRLDSSYTVWEVDTNGVFLRQLTSRDMVGPATAVALPATDRDYSIRSSYPHPGSGIVTVEYDVGKEGCYTLELIDMSGEALRHIVTEAWLGPGRYEAPLSTDRLPSGMYLICLSSKTGALVYHKLIVRR